MSERTLTDEDIAAIKLAIAQDHVCRFSDIDQTDMVEAVKFYKHFNTVMQESGSVIRKTIIVIGVGGLITLIGMGLVVKIKGFLVAP